MKPGAPMQECEKIKNGLINNGFQINEIVGVNMTILNLEFVAKLYGFRYQSAAR